MSTPIRVTGFLFALAVAFAGALGVGRLVGPLDVEVADEHGTHGDEAGEQSGDDHGDHESGGEALPAGLTATSDGFTLELDTDAVRTGSGVPVSFTVIGPDGAPVTAYDEVHEKELHLIAVRRDTTGFQHVHPTRDVDGTWHTELDLTAGVWRLLADFTATGADPLVLGADLPVPGDFDPAPAGSESRTDTVDGYTVELTGDLSTGAGGALTLTVTRDGRPVTDLQPYLGAHGHLVALRASDLAYLHVHPEETGSAGPEVVFHATAPSDGRYRLFLDFRHGDVVRTAEFTLEAGSDDHDNDEHDHDSQGGSHDH